MSVPRGLIIRFTRMLCIRYYSIDRYGIDDPVALQEPPSPMVTQTTAGPEELPPPTQPAHQSSFVFFFHNILYSMMYNLLIVIYRLWLMLLSHQDGWWLMCDEVYWNCSTDQLNWQSRTSWCQASSSSESLYITLSYVGKTAVSEQHLYSLNKQHTC